MRPAVSMGILVVLVLLVRVLIHMAAQFAGN